ncbi:MAG: NADH-quinone oxidoreductase subunit N, partial [Bradymonadia bacterium]
ATGSTNLAVIGDVLAMGAGSGDAIAATARNAALGAAAGLSPTDLPASSNITGVLGHIPLLAIGVVLVVVGFSVKVAAVPFHMWAPDVYTGSPTPMVGFMASAVKAAGFAAMFRIFAVALFDAELRMGPYGWVQVVFWISLLSMVLGNLVALTQTNVKRMLAFSSVAHAGYLMIAICAMGYGDGNIDFGSGIVFYSFAYTFGTIGAFGVLSWFGKRGEEAETFDDLNGLGFSHPWLGAVLTLFMLSSAGIPPAAGFIGKFMIFNSAVEAATKGSEAGIAGSNMLYVLVVVGILTSVAGVAYYLRVLVHLYMKKPLREVPAIPQSGARLAIALCAIATIWFGVFPAKLTTLSTDAVAQMLDRGDGVAAVEMVSED